MFTDLTAFALSDTAVYWIKEGVGILASAFVLISFLFSNERKTRIINIVGAAIFVVYATSVMNGALIVVHIVKLTKEHMAKKKQQNTLDNREQSSAEGQTSSSADSDEPSCEK